MLTLRPYQEKGVEFLKTRRRAMLRDAPGLGKTIQALRAAEIPVLISCPTYAMQQWADVIRSEYPSHKVVQAVGTRQEREKALKSKYDWLIVNHEMFQERRRKDQRNIS